MVEEVGPDVSQFKKGDEPEAQPVESWTGRCGSHRSVRSSKFCYTRWAFSSSRIEREAIMNTTHSSSLAAEVPAYAQLQHKMHDALLAQHPDWILPSGDCPTCDSYDARLAELLIVSLATERALAHRPKSLKLTNTTKIPTFFVRHDDQPARDPW